jgi:hypothetical protein
MEVIVAGESQVIQPEPDEDKMRNLLCLMACLLVVACSSENQEAETAESTEQTTDAIERVAEQSKSALDDMAVELAVRNVSCGCKVEGIGECGNYVEIGSQYVEIANSEELGLGNMEWCKLSHVTANVAGEVKDGMFVGTTLAVQHKH